MDGFFIYTFGNGEGLSLLFNSITAILNRGSEGNLFNAFVTLGFFAGMMAVILSAMTGELLRKILFWMLPFYATLALLFLPTTSLHIIDKASGYTAKVDHVPWGLGALAGTLSTLSYHMTAQIESIFSLPDDLKYHQTGAMMASNLLASAKTFHIPNLEIAETMKDFVNQCVVYDALRGTRFTLDDLKNAADLWKFMQDNASQARAFTYQEPGTKKSQILTCSDGIKKLETLLTGEMTKGFTLFADKLFLNKSKTPPLQGAKNLLKIHLASAFGYMTGLQGMSADAENVMRQNMMIYTVIDAIESKSTALGNAPNFAMRRAYLQQRTTQETMAGLAEKTMLALKNVLEALCYALFIFVLPLIMLPQGWRYLGNWASLVLWIHMWPPLYAIVNFIMSISAQQKSIALLGNAGGLTLANSVGFADLHADMAAQAGYMSLSVGALAYALVKGGTSGFMSLAGGLSQSLNSAAGRAVEDQLSGNYSFGNIGVGSVQAYNQTFGQEMHSPSYQSGAFSQNEGHLSKVSTVDGHHYVNVANSQLRSTPSWGENLSATFTEQANTSLTSAKQSLQALSDAETQGYRATMDFAAQQVASQSLGDSKSISEQQNQQQTYTQLDQMVDQFAKENRISKEIAWNTLGKAMGGWSLEKSIFGKAATALGFTAGVELSSQYGKSGSDADIATKARQFAENTSFQTVLNDAQHFSQEQRLNQNDEASKRLSETIASSLDKAQTYRLDAQTSLQRAETYTQSAQYARQNNTALQANLTQEFVEWLPKQAMGSSTEPMGRQAAETLLAGDTQRLIPYQQRFIETYAASFKDTVAAHSAGSFEKVAKSYEAMPSFTPPTSYIDQGLKNKIAAEGLGAPFEQSLKQKKKGLEAELKEGTTAFYSQMQHEKNLLAYSTRLSKGENAVDNPLAPSVFENGLGTSPFAALKQDIQSMINQELEELKEQNQQKIDPKVLNPKGS